MDSIDAAAGLLASPEGPASEVNRRTSSFGLGRTRRARDCRHCGFGSRLWHLKCRRPLDTLAISTALGAEYSLFLHVDDCGLFGGRGDLRALSLKIPIRGFGRPSARQNLSPWLGHVAYIDETSHILETGNSATTHATFLEVELEEGLRAGQFQKISSHFLDLDFLSFNSFHNHSSLFVSSSPGQITRQDGFRHSVHHLGMSFF